MRCFSFYLVCFFLVTFTAWKAFAWPLDLAVVPYHDGNGDDESTHVADSVRKSLALTTPHHVTDPEIAAAVLVYHRETPRQSADNLLQATTALGKAKDHYFHFQNEEAFAKAKQATELAEELRVRFPEAGAVLLDALVTQGVVAQSMGRKGIARDSFARAIRLQPAYVLDGSAFSPAVLSLFTLERKAILKGAVGRLEVVTDPEVAEVFLNGNLVGVTPFTLDPLPAGDYELQVKTNRYDPVKERIAIAGGQTLVVKKKLHWSTEVPRSQNKMPLIEKEEGRDQVARGIKAADILKVDRVIVVDVDANEEGGRRTTARMVDRRYRAGFVPLIVEYPTASEGSSEMARLMKALVDQARIDPMTDPLRHLDPLGDGDPVLLAGRKEKHRGGGPLLWGGLGTAAAGGLIAGILAAMSDDGGRDTGSLRLSFK